METETQISKKCDTIHVSYYEATGYAICWLSHDISMVTMAVSELTPAIQSKDARLWSLTVFTSDVYKVSLITRKHTVDEGHVAKSLGVRSLLHV